MSCEHLPDEHFAADKRAVTSCRNDWVKTAIRWIKRPSDKEETKGARKLFMKKTYKWVCTLDAVLQKSTGKDLLHWSVPERDRPHWSTWPYLSVAIDQGSDGVSARWFLRTMCALIANRSGIPATACGATWSFVGQACA